MLLVVALLVALPSPTQQHFEGHNVADGAVDIRTIVPLGANVELGLVAIKVVNTAVDYDSFNSSSLSADRVEAFDCHYKGMHATPYDGVVLTLLGKDTRGWEVYRASHATTGCTTPELSKKYLAEAKAEYAKAGIAVDKPTPFTVVPKGGTIKLPGGPELVISEAQLECDERRSCDDATEAIKSLTLSVKGKDVHEVWTTFTTQHAGSAKFAVLGAYVAGTKAIFVLQYAVAVGMEGREASASYLAVTPVIDFAK